MIKLCLLASEPPSVVFLSSLQQLNCVGYLQRAQFWAAIARQMHTGFKRQITSCRLVLQQIDPLCKYSDMTWAHFNRSPFTPKCDRLCCKYIRFARISTIIPSMSLQRVGIWSKRIRDNKLHVLFSTSLRLLIEIHNRRASLIVISETFKSSL